MKKNVCLAIAAIAIAAFFTTGCNSATPAKETNTKTESVSTVVTNLNLSLAPEEYSDLSEKSLQHLAKWYLYVSPINNMADFDKNTFASLQPKMGNEAFNKMFADFDKCYFSHRSNTSTQFIFINQKIKNHETIITACCIAISNASKRPGRCP